MRHLLLLLVLFSPAWADDPVLLVLPIETPGDYAPLPQADLMGALEGGIKAFKDWGVTPRQASLPAPSDHQAALALAKAEKVPFLVWGSVTFSKQLKDHQGAEKQLEVTGATDLQVLLAESGRLIRLKSNITRSFQGPVGQVEKEEQNLARACVTSLSEALMEHIKAKLSEPPPPVEEQTEG